MNATKEHCPVCSVSVDSLGVSAFTLVTSRGARRWTRCVRCRSYFDTTPYHVSEELSHTRTRPWGQLPSGLQLNQHKARLFRSVLRLLDRHAASRSTLLDIGCAYGGFLQCARDHGYEVFGMDILPEAVAHVRRLGFACEAAGSASELLIGDASVDVISVLDCNYYWPSQPDELQAIRKKLRPGGLLVMRVADKSWLLTVALAVRRWLPRLGERLSERAVNDHRVSIPVRALLDILRGAGFEVLYASPRGAVHSDRSGLAVRLMSTCGHLWWRATGLGLAPGWLLLARKTDS